MRSIILKSLLQLLKPLIRLLLRNGIAFAEFADTAKRAYVEVAYEDFAVPGRKQSASRIAVLTGIHRHEVAKVLGSKDETEDNLGAKHNRLARIITAWQNDSDFSANGKALPLKLEDEFPQLIVRHGADVTIRAVLDELTRVGAVRQSGDSIELLVEALAPQDSLEDLHYILGVCTTDLLETLDYNLQSPADKRRLQMSVVYDNIPDEVLETLELISSDKGMKFLTEINNFFATQDRDHNPAVKGTGRNRAGIGLYYFQKSSSKPDAS